MSTQILKKRLKEKCCHYFFRHPLEAFLCSFIVLPAGILLIVTGFTTLLIFPLGLFFGWL